MNEPKPTRICPHCYKEIDLVFAGAEYYSDFYGSLSAPWDYKGIRDTPNHFHCPECMEYFTLRELNDPIKQYELRFNKDHFGDPEETVTKPSQCCMYCNKKIYFVRKQHVTSRSKENGEPSEDIYRYTCPKCNHEYTDQDRAGNSTGPSL